MPVAASLGAFGRLPRDGEACSQGLNCSNCTAPFCLVSFPENGETPGNLAKNRVSTPRTITSHTRSIQHTAIGTGFGRTFHEEKQRSMVEGVLAAARLRLHHLPNLFAILRICWDGALPLGPAHPIKA